MDFHHQHDEHHPYTQRYQHASMVDPSQLYCFKTLQQAIQNQPQASVNLILGKKNESAFNVPFCTLENPCQHIQQVLRELNNLMNSTAFALFISMPQTRAVVVNVQIMDDMEEENLDNVLETPLYPRLQYYFVFSSYSKSQKTLQFNTPSVLRPDVPHSIIKSRPDLAWVVFFNLNIENLYFMSTQISGLSFCSSILNSTFVQLDSTMQTFSVETSIVESSELLVRSPLSVYVLYTKFYSFNELYFRNMQLTVLSSLIVRDSGIRLTVENGEKMFLQNSQFQNYHLELTTTNIKELHISYTQFINSTNFNGIVTSTHGQLFLVAVCTFKGSGPFLFVRAYKRVESLQLGIENNVIIPSFIYQAMFGIITVQSSIEVYMESCYFRNNTGLGKASSLYLSDIDRFTINATQFIDGSKGSAIVLENYHTHYLYGAYNTIITNCLFENNQCEEFGCAFNDANLALDLTVKDSIFRNNKAALGGGAIYIETAIHFNLLNCTFEGNLVTYHDKVYYTDGRRQIGAGGAVNIFSFLPPVEVSSFIRDCTFIKNTAAVGGALFYVGLSTKSVENCEFKENLALVKGGAIFHYNCQLNETNMKNVKFDHNMALIFGDDYISDITNFSFNLDDGVSMLEFMPGDSIVLNGTALSLNTTVPLFLETIYIDTSNPQLYVISKEFSNYLNISVYIRANDSNSVVYGIHNTTMRTEVSPKERFLPFKINPCKEGYRLALVDVDGTSSLYSCQFNQELPIAIILIVVVPIVFIFFFIGTCIGVLCGVNVCVDIRRRLKRLQDKEKAELSVEQKIIDKAIVFNINQDDYVEAFTSSSSSSLDKHYSQSTSMSHESMKKKMNRKDELGSPLLALNQTEVLTIEMERKPMSFLIPITDLEIIKKIGEGGLGTVYHGKWKDRDVAIKSLKTRMDDDDENDEFEKEVSLLASLRHPCILTFFGVAVSKENKFMVTEYLENGSLERIIYNCKIGRQSLSILDKLRILQDVASGMDYLHSLSPAIVHRDLKPGNVLLDKNNRCKVCDFGLSRTIGTTTSYTMTRNVGTLLYMSPEMISEEDGTFDSF
ncbi:hypothetical protein FDP41_013274 [Naegleria fowleri]|uniref:Protein kinase domain-containing protein n=1 Tax=Naegleria fowleri TaxID=5763 RepID=A0A6A5C1D9_NAEFO|nr:uncharacterized protein FDP41_013274 [Naegleria fowleri]KAF0980791.1 hypothetical protein FDP41_013274 [Naegleria fowleri]